MPKKKTQMLAESQCMDNYFQVGQRIWTELKGRWMELRHENSQEYLLEVAKEICLPAGQ